MRTQLLVLAFLAVADAKESLVTVKSPSWEINGKRSQVLEREVDEFLGIPYAVPPVGEKRFKKPEYLASFPEKIEALKVPPSCVQIPFLFEAYINLFYKFTEEQKEDCLYLNIWRPAAEDDQLKQLKAVLVWIHGGAFLAGSSGLPFCNGAILSAFGDVVVVSLNYRLGSFGFFSAGTEEESGNLGLYDQNMALKWVKENIHHFGGDPDRITLFGESAGGISVSAHVTSPLSKGLFQRAIIESGTTTMPKFVDSKKEVVGISDKIAEKLKCTVNGATLESNPDEVLKCMRAKDAAEIVAAERAVYKEGEGYTQLAAIYDEDFLGYKSQAPFRPSTINDVDIMIGVNKDEAGNLFALIFPELFNPAKPKLTCDQIRSELKNLFSTRKNKPKVDEIYDKYMEGVPKDNTTACNLAMISIMTHHLFSCPSFYYINHQEFKKQKVYFYYYTHHSTLVAYTMHLEKLPGAFHGDEVPYVFGFYLALKLSIITEQEVEFSKQLIGLWSSFAKFGTPESSRHYYWPLYKRSNPQVLELKASGASVMKFPPADLCWSRWRDVFSPPTSEKYCYKRGDGTEECDDGDED